MDLETLKPRLDDATFAELQQYVTDLIGARDAARNESITGRKGKDARIKELTERVQALTEYLGVEPDADLETLPDAKGAIEASKQFEARVKRLERQLTEANQKAEEASGKYRSSLQRAAIADSLSGHDFLARDLVETYVSQRLVWEDDDLLFRTDEGKLVPVQDGVAGIAKTRPELLKPTGAGGAGIRQSNAGSVAKVMPEAQFNSLPPKEQARVMSEGYTLTN